MSAKAKVDSIRWKLTTSTGRELLVYREKERAARELAAKSLKPGETIISAEHWGSIRVDAKGREHYQYPDTPHVEVDNAPARETRK